MMENMSQLKSSEKELKPEFRVVAFIPFLNQVNHI